MVKITIKKGEDFVETGGFINKRQGYIISILMTASMESSPQQNSRRERYVLYFINPNRYLTFVIINICNHQII
ncbi:MAG: hypothetical protein AMS27_03700 [Bacteroides sp. SM23_62_1]|nr:MAG: hypothetical protein AMS27_03700 [Bacteroides sp. SM23_62_1]